MEGWYRERTTDCTTPTTIWKYKQSITLSWQRRQGKRFYNVLLKLFCYFSNYLDYTWRRMYLKTEKLFLNGKSMNIIHHIFDFKWTILLFLFRLQQSKAFLRSIYGEPFLYISKKIYCSWFDICIRKCRVTGS